MKITEIAEALVAVIDGVPTLQESYLWEPKDMKVPSGSVGLPTLERTDPDEAESQLHADDWNLEFMVSLYFEFANVNVQQQMADALEEFTDAIDADRSLGGKVLDASVTDAVMFKEFDRKRPLVGYEVTVSVVRLVSNP